MDHFRYCLIFMVHELWRCNMRYTLPQFNPILKGAPDHGQWHDLLHGTTTFPWQEKPVAIGSPPPKKKRQYQQLAPEGITMAGTETRIKVKLMALWHSAFSEVRTWCGRMFYIIPKMISIALLYRLPVNFLYWLSPLEKCESPRMIPHNDTCFSKRMVVIYLPFMILA